MLLGFFYAVVACAIWGLIYIFPLILPEYDPVLIASGRFAVYGLACLAFVPFQFQKLKELSRSDWFYAMRLAFFGSFVYYWSLVMSVQLSGAPIAGMLMCWIPVLVAVVSNLRNRKRGASIAWSRLGIPLGLILCGMVVANWTEFYYAVHELAASPLQFWTGVGCGVLSLLLWTWYPIRNADWLLANKTKGPKIWATAQGLSILPFTLIGFFVVSSQMQPADVGILGPEPLKFIVVMLVAGIVCSWVGAAFWNAMSERLPTALGGQLIVFETIFSVIYALMWRGAWPTVSMTIGMFMLLFGVLTALRVFRNVKA